MTSFRLFKNDSISLLLFYFIEYICSMALNILQCNFFHRTAIANLNQDIFQI